MDLFVLFLLTLATFCKCGNFPNAQESKITTTSSFTTNTPSSKFKSKMWNQVPAGYPKEKEDHLVPKVSNSFKVLFHDTEVDVPVILRTLFVELPKIPNFPFVNIENYVVYCHAEFKLFTKVLKIIEVNRNDLCQCSECGNNPSSPIARFLRHLSNFNLSSTVSNLKSNVVYSVFLEEKVDECEKSSCFYIDSWLNSNILYPVLPDIVPENPNQTAHLYSIIKATDDQFPLKNWKSKN